MHHVECSANRFEQNAVLASHGPVRYLFLNTSFGPALVDTLDKACAGGLVNLIAQHQLNGGFDKNISGMQVPADRFERDQFVDLREELGLDPLATDQLLVCNRIRTNL